MSEATTVIKNRSVRGEGERGRGPSWGLRLSWVEARPKATPGWWPRVNSLIELIILFIINFKK